MFRYKCRSWFLLDPILTSRMALIHSDSLVWRLGFHSVCPVITCSIPLSIIWCGMMRNLPLSHSLKWVSAHGSDEGAGCHRCCTRVLCDGHLHPDCDMLYMLIVIEPGLVCLTGVRTRDLFAVKRYSLTDSPCSPMSGCIREIPEDENHCSFKGLVYLKVRCF